MIASEIVDGDEKFAANSAIAIAFDNIFHSALPAAAWVVFDKAGAEFLSVLDHFLLDILTKTKKNITTQKSQIKRNFVLGSKRNTKKRLSREIAEEEKTFPRIFHGVKTQV